MLRTGQGKKSMKEEGDVDFFVFYGIGEAFI
jgi:hypothetical protein